MEYLNIRESVLNCPVCRNSDANRRQTSYLKQYIQAFSQEMHQLWQNNYKYTPVIPDTSFEKLFTNKTMMQKYQIPPYSKKDTLGYEQIYRNTLVKKYSKKSNKKIKKHRKTMPTIVYQIYTFTTDNDDDKPKRKPSRVYSYPYSSSSSETSTSLFDKDKKKSVSLYPATKTCGNDEDTDSEFNTCHHFPITEKHYRHIVDGIECSSRNQNKQSSSRKKPQEEKKKITMRADDSFNQINFKPTDASNSNAHACHMKSKKKCNCKSKCKPDLHAVEEDEERSDSELSEKTFTKFINSLHTYVNKAKKYNHKHQRKRLDSDSSCTFCKHDDVKKKKSTKEHDAKKHHHHHHHHQARHKTEAEDILKKYMRE